MEGRRRGRNILTSGKSTTPALVNASRSTHDAFVALWHPVIGREELKRVGEIE